jgi:hypothetical protein
MASPPEEYEERALLHSTSQVNRSYGKRRGEKPEKRIAKKAQPA